VRRAGAGPLSRAAAAGNSDKDVHVNPMLSTLPTLLVTSIYYFWCVYHRERLRRARLLRERVAFLLWVAAERIPDEAA
jgi:hypothetical protein